MSEFPHIEGLSDLDLAAETKAVNKIKQVSNPPIDGEKFIMCGVEVVVPALKAKHMVRYAEQMLSLTKSPETVDDFFAYAVPIIHAALTRNYPTLTTDDVMELLDSSVLQGVIASIMGRSGYRKAQPGE